MEYNIYFYYNIKGVEKILIKGKTNTVIIIPEIEGGVENKGYTIGMGF